MLDDDTEEKIIDALVSVEYFETDDLMESATIVQGLLRCSPEDAEAIVNDLENRKRIEREWMQSGGQLVELKRTPPSRWRWRRPK